MNVGTRGHLWTLYCFVYGDGLSPPLLRQCGHVKQVTRIHGFRAPVSKTTLHCNEIVRFGGGYYNSHRGGVLNADREDTSTRTVVETVSSDDDKIII